MNTRLYLPGRSYAVTVAQGDGITPRDTVTIPAIALPNGRLVTFPGRARIRQRIVGKPFLLPLPLRQVNQVLRALRRDLI